MMHFKYNFPRYTYSDYVNWKEDWELIDGYPMQFLPSATFSHNKVQGNLYFQAKLALSKNDENCTCEVVSELDWKISIDTVVRPDLMVVCDKITTDYLETPPVLIVEVLSKSSINRDRVIKFDLYREQGVNYYLLVNFEKKAVEVFELIDNLYKQVYKTIFKIDDNCEIAFDFSTIWK